MRNRTKPLMRGNCTKPNIRNLIMFYVNGDVTENQRTRIKSHLPHCFDCQDELRFFLALYELRRRQVKAAKKKSFSSPKH